jgi:transposase
MKTPIFVRSLSEEERESLEKGLRSKDAFTMRRSQMLLASSRGERAPKIALNLGCASQTVRDAINDFNHRGLDALDRKSSRPRKTRDAFDQRSAESLRGMLQRSPREFGRESSLWTLEMAADVAFQEGSTPERVSGETIRATLSRLLSVRWMRPLGGGSPLRTPSRKEKKASFASDRLMEIAGANPEWAVGFEDECWWSRGWLFPP